MDVNTGTKYATCETKKKKKKRNETLSEMTTFALFTKALKALYDDTPELSY